MWFFLATLLALITDRVIKNLALHGVLGDVGPLHFGLVRNDALVFSWPAPNSMAAGLMLVAIIVVLWLIRQALRRGELVAAGAGALILAGALSNLFDRIRYGFVIDWAYLGPWWPVMNLADIMIGVGVMLMILRWCWRKDGDRI